MSPDFCRWTQHRETTHHWDLFTMATSVTFLPQGNSPLTVQLQIRKSPLNRAGASALPASPPLPPTYCARIPSYETALAQRPTPLHVSLVLSASMCFEVLSLFDSLIQLLSPLQRGRFQCCYASLRTLNTIIVTHMP